MCDYSRKPVKWQVGNFSLCILVHLLMRGAKLDTKKETPMLLFVNLC